MTKRQYKERRLYFSGECAGCGHSFQSFKRSKIKAGLCRKCLRLQPPKGQDSLFVDADGLFTKDQDGQRKVIIDAKTGEFFPGDDKYAGKTFKQSMSNLINAISRK